MVNKWLIEELEVCFIDKNGNDAPGSYFIINQVKELKSEWQYQLKGSKGWTLTVTDEIHLKIKKAFEQGKTSVKIVA